MGSSEPDVNDAKSIFGKAQEIESSAERAAYLDEACLGNADLRAEVERLLAASNEAGPFMAEPAAWSINTAAMPPVSEGTGTVIGPYKLMELIGEGGFGLVFVAEQHRPVRRKVALKIIKPGMDTHDVIARFEAERQALALMDHPNIAKVFDAGATDSGRPYFVMELVRGMSITEFCDQRRLTPRERLELFVFVCHAIQHAHQKGIIHRDVKPTNVLVTLHDGRPVVKVIDFGVAKALSQQLTERTIYTQFAQMLGTPLYMSPEQAEMSGLDIDTRSDIYSLGVLLYELLTGSTPFDRQRLRQAAVLEIRRILCEEEPPKPSTRLTQSGERLASIAAQRNTEPAKLRKVVRGDLDWIVMKCLEKDRARRYESASGLAVDIQRHLNDEPVLASSPSGWYRLRKLARRNKAALLTLTLLALVLLLGTGVSTLQLIRAMEAEKLAHTRWEAETRARRDADAERAKAVAAQKQAEEQRDRALRAEQQALANFQKAREAVDQMLTRVAGERLDNVPLMEPIRKALVEDALRFYQDFLQQKSDDPSLRMETAVAWRRYGIMHQHLNETAKAEAAYKQSVDMLQKLMTEFPSQLTYQREMACSYTHLARMLTYQGGRDQEAEDVTRKGLDRLCRKTCTVTRIMTLCVRTSKRRSRHWVW